MSPAVDPILPFIDPALLQQSSHDSHQPLPAPVPSISERVDGVVDVTPQGTWDSTNSTSNDLVTTTSRCFSETSSSRSAQAGVNGGGRDSTTGLVRTQKRGRTQASTTSKSCQCVLIS
jgi:hypothetical protein